MRVSRRVKGLKGAILTAVFNSGHDTVILMCTTCCGEVIVCDTHF